MLLWLLQRNHCFSTLNTHFDTQINMAIIESLCGLSLVCARTSINANKYCELAASKICAFSSKNNQFRFRFDWSTKKRNTHTLAQCQPRTRGQIGMIKGIGSILKTKLYHCTNDKRNEWINEWTYMTKTPQSYNPFTDTSNSNRMFK